MLHELYKLYSDHIYHTLFGTCKERKRWLKLSNMFMVSFYFFLYFLLQKVVTVSHFSIFFNFPFLFFSLCIIFFCFSNYVNLFSIAVEVTCNIDADCPQISDFIPIFYKCVNNICEILKPKTFFV